MGTYDVRAPILASLFSAATIQYALSLANHIYAAYTHRRAQYLPPLPKEGLKPEEMAFRCGERVERSIQHTYLMPLAIGLTPYLTVYNILFDSVSQQYRNISKYSKCWMYNWSGALMAYQWRYHKKSMDPHNNGGDHRPNISMTDPLHLCSLGSVHANLPH